MGGTDLSGLFAILFLATLVGIFKPYINGAKRWHFGLAAFISLIFVGEFAEPTTKSGAKPESAACAAHSGWALIEFKSWPVAAIQAASEEA